MNRFRSTCLRSALIRSASASCHPPKAIAPTRRQNGQSWNGAPHPQRSPASTPRCHRCSSSPTEQTPGSWPISRSIRVLPLRPNPPRYRTRKPPAMSSASPGPLMLTAIRSIGLASQQDRRLMTMQTRHYGPDSRIEHFPSSWHRPDGGSCKSPHCTALLPRAASPPDGLHPGQGVRKIGPVPHHRLPPRQHVTLALAQELNMHLASQRHISKQFFTYTMLYPNIYTKSNIGQ